MHVGADGQVRLDDLRAEPRELLAGGRLRVPREDAGAVRVGVLQEEPGDGTAWTPSE